MPTQTISPDVLGYYGDYGGMFIPEILRTTFEELISAFYEAKADPEFWQSFVNVMRRFWESLHRNDSMGEVPGFSCPDR